MTECNCNKNEACQICEPWPERSLDCAWERFNALIESKMIHPYEEEEE